jgi:uncharacterized protein (TIGR02588 family)
MSNHRLASRQTPPAEWITAITGALIILATMTLLLQEAACGVNGPPVLRAEVLSVSQAGSGFRVEVRVSNDGGDTAADVAVQGELVVDGQVVDRAEATVDYISGRSSAVAGLLFIQDPAAGRLAVRALGYRVP